MKHRYLLLLLALIAQAAAGCLQTRHVEASSVTTCDSCSSCSEATYNERCWWGPWLGKPSRAEP
jgi:hypothetical protein